MDAEGRAISLEIETQQKVSNSLSKIEVALAEWESAEKRPEGMEATIVYLKESHKMLMAWERKSLAGERNLKATVERLRAFAEICEKLEKLKGK